MNIILSGYILVNDEDLTVVSAALPEHIRLTRAEHGCIQFEVTVEPDKPNRYNVYERFADSGAFEHHQKRVAASHWGDVTKNVSRHYEISEIDSDQ